MSEYIVVKSYATGNPEVGYSLAYSSDLKRYPTLRQVICHGMHDLELSDDFLIGKVDGNTLLSLQWMERLRDDRDEAVEVAQQLCLAVSDEYPQSIGGQVSGIIERAQALPANPYQAHPQKAAMFAELVAEVERLHSWDGLMSLLDEHWPADIFPTQDDREDRDLGPRIVSLLRWVDQLRPRRIETVEELDTLPDFSVVRPLNKTTAASMEKHYGLWWVPGGDGCVAQQNWGTCVPALLLWTPEAQ